MQALIAQLFGNGHGNIGCLAANKRRLIRGRRNDDASLQAICAQIVLDEVLELAPAFAHEPDDDGVGVGIAGEHGEQRRLAHAGAEKDAHALAPAAGDERVERLDTQIELAADACARMCGGRLRLYWVADSAQGQGSLAIDRVRKSVQDPSEPDPAWIDKGRAIIENRASAEADPIEG